MGIVELLDTIFNVERRNCTSRIVTREKGRFRETLNIRREGPNVCIQTMSGRTCLELNDGDNASLVLNGHETRMLFRALMKHYGLAYTNRLRAAIFGERGAPWYVCSDESEESE